MMKLIVHKPPDMTYDSRISSEKQETNKRKTFYFPVILQNGFRGFKIILQSVKLFMLIKISC